MHVLRERVFHKMRLKPCLEEEGWLLKTKPVVIREVEICDGGTDCLSASCLTTKVSLLINKKDERNTNQAIKTSTKTGSLQSNMLEMTTSLGSRCSLRDRL